MLIFNNQCYETNAFDQYVLNKNRRKDQFLDGGYRSDTVRFKDPRTNEDFPFDYAVSTMIHRRISYRDLKEILGTRISGLTLEVSSIYVPSHDDSFEALNVDDLISHVTNA